MLPGIRVARVKCIFALTPRFSYTAHRLVYLEWFRPLRRADPDTRLFSIQPATRNGQRQAEVVPLDDLLQSVHLIPKFGANKNPLWTPWNIFDICDQFYVNNWIDFHTFYLFHNDRKL